MVSYFLFFIAKKEIPENPKYYSAASILKQFDLKLRFCPWFHTTSASYPIQHDWTCRQHTMRDTNLNLPCRELISLATSCCCCCCCCCCNFCVVVVAVAVVVGIAVVVCCCCFLPYRENIETPESPNEGIGLHCV